MLTEPLTRLLCRTSSSITIATAVAITGHHATAWDRPLSLFQLGWFQAQHLLHRGYAWSRVWLQPLPGPSTEHMRCAVRTVGPGRGRPSPPRWPDR